MSAPVATLVRRRRCRCCHHRVVVGVGGSAALARFWSTLSEPAQHVRLRASCSRRRRAARLAQRDAVCARTGNWTAARVTSTADRRAGVACARTASRARRRRTAACRRCAARRIRALVSERTVVVVVLGSDVSGWLCGWLTRAPSSPPLPPPPPTFPRFLPALGYFDVSA